MLRRCEHPRLTGLRLEKAETCNGSVAYMPRIRYRFGSAEGDEGRAATTSTKVAKVDPAEHRQGPEQKERAAPRTALGEHLVGDRGFEPR